MLVLGSTQPASIVRSGEVQQRSIEVLRRRSGGGAVLLVPGGQLWIDLWVPRDDPLWDDDVLAAAGWVGDWWAEALRSAVVSSRASVAVHRGRSLPDPWSGQVCFGGVGAGEVLVGRRKVVGLAQWRARQGALFHCCAYHRWQPVAATLVDLLELPAPAYRAAARSTKPEDPWTSGRAAARAVLEDAACGVDGLIPGGDPLGTLLTGLLASLPRGGNWIVVDS